MDRPKPVILAILDGWGVAPPSKSNAISQAKTPVMDSLISGYPSMTLQASGQAVGLPWGEMGNSEVGHLTIGSGKIIYQSFPRITQSIWDKSFFENKALLQATSHAKKKRSALHLLGLVSSGGVHSYIEHLYALLELAKKEKIKKVYIHVILDGRDTPRDSGKNFVSRLKERIDGLGVGEIASISGRFWAMDRDNRWERIQAAYLAMTQGKSEKTYEDPIKAIEESYQDNVFDEEFVPTVITKNGEPVAKIKDKEAVIFFNFRSDRARQLTKAFVLPGFEKFTRAKYLEDFCFVTMTEYDPDLPIEVAFRSEKIEKPLAKIISDAELKQLRIAETEKYAHITYFFNGGQEEAFPGEERVMIPSPKVTNYDQKPEMAVKEVTKAVVKGILSNKYDFICINFANPDMVGHTGNLEGTIKAVESIDQSLGEIKDALLTQGGVMLVTADHGNAEELTNLQTGSIEKEHTTNPVPFIAVGQEWEGKNIGLAETIGSDLSLVPPQGLLADIAPTILKIMNLPIPEDMVGRPLV